MRRWLSSLEGQLVVRLSAVFLAAIAITALVVVLEAYWTAATLHDEALAHEFLGEFVSDVAWVIPIFAVAVLAVAVWTVRRGIRPIRRASEMASRINAAATGVRLPHENLPVEIVPLVTAVNAALDRLERGFAAQRQFTARAAHELRTPLAILSAGLENLHDGPEVEKLLADVRRMNRMVQQLLQVARLDALPLDSSSKVDLRTVAADTVEYLAPWAVSSGRSLALDAPEIAVIVRGNADALAEALQNLVENAATYAPAGTEVTVSVDADGSISVTDRGPGVPAEDRERIFERFWRAPAARKASQGAGLGLAIVAEIARTHGASIEVRDASGGGARFTIRFPLV